MGVFSNLLGLVEIRGGIAELFAVDHSMIGTRPESFRLVAQCLPMCPILPVYGLLVDVVEVISKSLLRYA